MVLAAQHHTSLDFEKAAHCGGIRFGDVGDGINVAEFARRDDGREQRPIFGLDLVSGEQCILARKSHGSDGVLDRVRIQFKAAVFQEPGKAGPVAQGVADVASQRGT